MKRYQRNILRNELRAAGAAAAEVDELLSLADDLHLLGHTRTAPSGKSLLRHGLRIVAVPSACVLASVAVGALIIAFAQVASPTSWLFPVQKATDAVAVKLHPQYREVVMMRRADQVSELVSDHASSQSEISALADYTQAADVYKVEPHANYAAFQYCESRLSQAAKMATPQVSQAIHSSLDSLDTT